MKESNEMASSNSMDDLEYRSAYANSFMNACIAAQIKTIREQRGLTQAELAEKIGTQQAGISRLENVNYDAWKVATLVRLAKAFDVWLKITFEEFETLPSEVKSFNRENLQRESYERRKEIEREVAERVLTPKEGEALNPAAKQNVKATPNLFVVPSNNESDMEKKAEKADAPDIDSARQSTRIFGMGWTELTRKGPSRDDGPEVRGGVPFPFLSDRTQAIRNL